MVRNASFTSRHGFLVISARNSAWPSDSLISSVTANTSMTGSGSSDTMIARADDWPASNDAGPVRAGRGVLQFQFDRLVYLVVAVVEDGNGDGGKILDAVGNELLCSRGRAGVGDGGGRPVAVRVRPEHDEAGGRSRKSCPAVAVLAEVWSGIARSPDYPDCLAIWTLNAAFAFGAASLMVREP